MSATLRPIEKARREITTQLSNSFLVRSREVAPSSWVMGPGHLQHIYFAVVLSMANPHIAEPVLFQISVSGERKFA